MKSNTYGGFHYTDQHIMQELSPYKATLLSYILSNLFSTGVMPY